ncbi:MAG: peptidylprolyl isomerase, partial [Planctomycetales bacterium]
RAATSAGVVDKDHKPDFEKWFKMIDQEQEISQDVYLTTIVWPSAAMRKLVDGQAKVSEEDMQKGFEANYGPRVRCRAIVMQNLRRAQEVWEMYRRNPTLTNFSGLAAEYSIDPGGKSLGGVVPPIQRHGGQGALEKEAFKLKPGQHSGIIQVGDKFIFLLCEGHTKPVTLEMKDVQDVLHNDILEKKYRILMARRFQQIIAKSQFTNHLYPEPSKERKENTARRQDPRQAGDQPARG